MIKIKSYKKSLPYLENENILLNPINKDDLDTITACLQHKVFNDNTTNIPYPYTQKNAKDFYEMVKEGFREQTHFVFAIREKDNDEFVGLVGIHPDMQKKHAETGYWIAMQHWNKGFATQALKLVISFAFDELGIKKIFASHFSFNGASGKVMSKAGMHYEGTLKKHLFKNGEMVDLIQYGIFKD